LLRAGREWKGGETLRGVGKCSGEMIHSISLFRQQVNAQLTMNDNGKARSSAFIWVKISSFDPLLTLI
jgi:hypothetical protein